MNFKDLIVPFGLAILTTWGLQRWFGSAESPLASQAPAESGQRVQAPTAGIQVHKPLNLAVDFLDKKPVYQKVTTTIQTSYARFRFSTEGGSLEQLEFVHEMGDRSGYITTVFAPNMYEQEQRCFLLAFDEKTPYYFELVDHQEDEQAHELIYKASFDGGVVSKTFTIDKIVHQIDLKVALEFSVPGQTSIQPRLFFVSPCMPELHRKDTISGLVNSGKDHIIPIGGDGLIDGYWQKPTLFGAQNRYYVHVLAHDQDGFVGRGYFKQDEGRIYPILEGPLTDTSTVWHMRFYFGPKIDDMLGAVDARLEQVIDYGMLGPVSKWLSEWLLELLNFINRYVNNYGVAIIILTLLLRLIMVPFTLKTERSMHAGKEFSKKLKYVQEKHKSDPEALAKARAELVQKHGLPGFGGCVPLLLQIPIFLALRDVLSNSIEMYKAPFVWIPDLSLPDPYYIFAFLTGAGMIAQSVKADAQQRPMMIGMGLFFAALLSNFSAGLALYICVSTLAGVAQTMILRK